MTRSLFVLSVLAFGLAACQSVPESAAPVDLRRELVLKTGASPPEGPIGLCWAADTIPAVIETRTSQILVRPERRDASGAVTSAAVFRSEAQQKIIQDRRDVWFRAPCPDQITVTFVASLQRALKARGLFGGAVNGQLDAPTRVAIRRYQEPLGLASERLSLAAARSLGLIAGEFEPE